MDSTLIFAIITITLALIFYSIGVWAEKLQKTLKGWHVAFFLLGLVCDTLGTNAMSQIAGGFSFTLHGVTGFVALVLMFIHALWAVMVLAKNDEIQKAKFHKFSLIVWLIWLIPYFLGMFLGMA